MFGGAGYCRKLTSNVSYVYNIEDADEVVRRFEELNTSKYVTSKQRKNFGKGVGPIHLNSRILWEDIANTKAAGYRLQFDGVPFMVVGHKILDCHHGVDRHIAAKEKYKTKRQTNEIQCKRRKMIVRETKKVGCAAKIRMREILKFPDHMIVEDARANRLKSSKQLKKDIADSTKHVSFERRIYIELPNQSDHCNHSTGEDGAQSQRIDKVIVKFIHCQVYAGVESVDEIKERILLFVRDNLFRGRSMPPTTTRRYHPRNRDIKNHIYAAKSRMKSLSKIEVEEFDVLKDLISRTSPTPLTFIENTPPTTENMSPNTTDMNLRMLNDGSKALTCMNGTTGNINDNQLCIDSGYIDADESDGIVSPLTIQLQVEPEDTKEMVGECDKLLEAIRLRTKDLADPDILYRVCTKLKDIMECLDEEQSETVSQADKSTLPDIRCLPKYTSLLETKLRKSNICCRKRPLTWDNEFSDFEVHCETQDST